VAVIEEILGKGKQEDTAHEAERLMDGGFLTVAYFHDGYEEEIATALSFYGVDLLQLVSNRSTLEGLGTHEFLPHTVTLI